MCVCLFCLFEDCLDNSDKNKNRCVADKDVCNNNLAHMHHHYYYYYSILHTTNVHVLCVCERKCQQMHCNVCVCPQGGWTRQEDELLLSLYTLHGSNWSRIAKALKVNIYIHPRTPCLSVCAHLVCSHKTF